VIDKEIKVAVESRWGEIRSAFVDTIAAITCAITDDIVKTTRAKIKEWEEEYGFDVPPHPLERDDFVVLIKKYIQGEPVADLPLTEDTKRAKLFANSQMIKQINIFLDNRIISEEEKDK